VLPGNVRLDWKVIAKYKPSSLFGLQLGLLRPCPQILRADWKFQGQTPLACSASSSVMKEKSFVTLPPGGHVGLRDRLQRYPEQRIGTKTGQTAGYCNPHLS
jgi:hypothetical protein